MTTAEKEAQKRTLVHMAVREILMEYYKNVSQERFVRVEGIRLRDARTDTNFQYQRQLKEMRQHKRLEVGGFYLAEMTKNPSTFKILVDPKSSPIVGEFFDGVTKFLADYLPGVEIEIEPIDVGDADYSRLYRDINVSLLDPAASAGRDYIEHNGYRLYTSNLGVDPGVQFATTPQEAEISATSYPTSEYIQQFTEAMHISAEDVSSRVRPF